MFAEIKLGRTKNVILVDLFHDEHKIENSEMRTYGKHCESIVVDNENNGKNNIAAIETTHQQ